MHEVNVSQVTKLMMNCINLFRFVGILKEFKDVVMNINQYHRNEREFDDIVMRSDNLMVQKCCIGKKCEMGGFSAAQTIYT